MSLIVEDGTGRADAEAYRSIADHKAYCDKRGIAYSNDDTVLEQQARKATDYLTQAYRDRWGGERTGITQALDWPRYLVPIPDAPGVDGSPTYYPSNSVPVELQNAQSELMIRAATADLNPDLARAILSETTGPISTTYDPNSPEATRYRAVDMILKPLLRFGSANNAMRLLRA